MAVTQYIGARYVPLFADPLEWDASKAYEPLTIVYYQGNSYTSKQAVPVGIEITNTTYWAITGNYNAQIEQYRTEVQNISTAVNAMESTIDTLESFGGEIECGVIEGKAVYTVIKLPKDQFRIDLKPVSTSDLTPGQELVNTDTVPNFAANNPYPIVTNVNNGATAIYNGVLYGNDYQLDSNSRSSFFGTTQNGEPVMLRSGNFSDMQNISLSAIGVWQILRQNSVNVPTVDYTTFIVPNPRQTFAWDDENYYIFTANARFGGLIGLTFDEVRTFGIARGWTDIISFDGGGSDCVVMKEPYSIMTPNVDSLRNWRVAHMVLTASKR